MTESNSESDWKYVRTIHDDLLASLCERINGQSGAILEKEDGSQHKKYLKLCRHIQDSDQIIGRCFNDLRRSTLLMKLAAQQEHGILTEKHLKRFSAETQQRLKVLKELQEK